jgi:glycosyltransferase involved in cell wall biosynthesis
VAGLLGAAPGRVSAVSGRRVLVLTYHWPPFSGAGAARWSALVTHLRQLGHEVTVVTTSLWGRSPAGAEEGVIRTRDLAAVGVLRRLFRRPVVRAETARAVAVPLGSESGPGLRSRILVPDPFVVSWVPLAAAAARRFLRQRPVDCVITSSPPDSIHLAGLALGRRRPAWIAELRDGWTFEPLRAPFPTGFQRRLDARLERAVACHADGLVAATGPIGDDLERRFERPVETIRNGWDPGLESRLAAAEPPALDPGRVNLVYTGSLGGIRGHDDRGLLAALRDIVREEPELAARLRVTIAGPLTEGDRAKLGSPELAPVVRTVGELPRPEALALQRRADALLLITSHHASIATGKLYEYLAAGRPILALAGENEAASIVAETGTGVSVAPDDIPGIRRALATVASGELERSYEPRGLDHYVYPAPARAFAEAIERAMERHRRLA